MRRMVGLFLAMAACGVASGAPAFHDNHDSAFAAAKEKGRAVLIVYSRTTTCPIAIGARNFILGNRTNLRFLAKSFVLAEVPISAGGKQYQGYRRQFKGKFIPFWVVATPDGEFIDGGDCYTIDSGAKSKWRRRVGKVAATHPPVNKKAREKATVIWKQAMVRFEQGDYAQAHAKATTIYKKAWYPKGMAAEAKGVLDKIAAAGQAALEEAEALAGQEKHLEAAIAWDTIVEGFSVRLPAGKAAAAKLRTVLAKHKDIKAPVDKARRRRQAVALLARARKLEADDKAAEAKTAYQALARKYGDTASAAAAAGALKRLGATVAKVVPAPSAAPTSSPPAGDAAPPGAKLLQLARTYRAAGMTTKARAKLVELIQSHPDSDSARQGRKLMTQWGIKPSG